MCTQFYQAGQGIQPVKFTDVSSMPSSYILDSIQEPLIAVTLRDLDVNSQGLALT